MDTPDIIITSSIVVVYILAWVIVVVALVRHYRNIK